ITRATNLPPLVVGNGLGIGMAEAIGAFFFSFGIASVVYGKANTMMSGIVIGASLFMGTLIASLLGSNGVLNPAVAFSIYSFNAMYILGPVVGSLVGFWTYTLLSEKNPWKKV
ncbi:MAG: hypothetical protein PHF79_01465, partial [Candidatus Pacebacteria bacterium]|nr:hypothetical protein [Candidatus Paceibacterota bacterium]